MKFVEKKCNHFLLSDDLHKLQKLTDNCFTTKVACPNSNCKESIMISAVMMYSICYGL